MTPLEVAEVLGTLFWPNSSVAVIECIKVVPVMLHSCEMEDDIFKELAAYKLKSAGIGQNNAGCSDTFSLLLSSSFHNIVWCLNL